jgi:hypothetical protein
VAPPLRCPRGPQPDLGAVDRRAGPQKSIRWAVWACR